MSCKIHLRNLLEWPGLFIILFHLFLWDSFPARVLAGLPDSTLDLYHSSPRATMFLKKAGSLERTTIVYNLMQQRSKTLWVLWNHWDTWKLFYCFFFYRKDKAKMNFSVCIHFVFIMNGCNTVHINTLKPSMSQKDFFYFLFSKHCAWSGLDKESFKIRGILYLKEENDNCL